MFYTVNFVKGKNKWVVRDENGIDVSEHDTQDDAKGKIRDLKDQEKQISLDI